MLKSTAPPPVPVRVVAATRQTVQQTTSQPATVEAYYQTNIRANVTGYVESLQVDIGNAVEAGDVLATIAVPELTAERQVIEAKIAMMRSEEQQADAALVIAKAKVDAAGAALDEARARQSQADASLAAAESEFGRTEDLVRRQSLQPKVLEEARMRRDSESANVASTAAAIQTAEAAVMVAKAQVGAAEAAVAAARSQTNITNRQLEQLDARIDYATLRAPFTGVVTDRSIGPGDLVGASDSTAGSHALLSVSQIDPVRVRIPVPESDAAQVNVGDSVTLTFASLASSEPVVGTVARTSGALDRQTRTLNVEVDLPNPDGRFLPGMFGQATIQTTQTEADMLPAQAVRFDETGAAYVYVIDQEEMIKIANVTTGLDDGHLIEITSGLDPEQRVIGSNLDRFVGGQKVRVLWD